MPITFFDLLDHSSSGWEALPFSDGDATFYWNDGGFMLTAPVDIAATLDGAIFKSDNPEPAFGMRGRRIKPDFTVPTRHHNLPMLCVVVGGDMTVTAEGETVKVASDGFWIAEPETAYSVTSGPEGVTYIECPPITKSLALIETYWHDDENWVRR